MDRHLDSAPHTLLAVFAHPDDESFGPGGTLARYAPEGVNVHYLCATRGDVGEVDATLLAQNGHAAAACHASQGGGSGLWNTLPLFVRRRLLASETFSRA